MNVCVAYRFDKSVKGVQSEGSGGFKVRLWDNFTGLIGWDLKY